MPTPTPTPIRSAADALDLLSVAVARPLEHQTLCIPLDADGRGGIVTVVNDTIPPDTVIHVVEAVTNAMQASRCTSLIVASVRPHSGLLPGDIDRWLEASDAADERGTRLLEWYVIGPRGIECPRDLLGEPERWPQPAG